MTPRGCWTNCGFAGRRSCGISRRAELILVVEQSELARIRPLTFVSVQRDGARPEVLALTDAEQARMHELFDDAFPERVLHLANLQNSEMLRSVALDARGVSAHARLAARLADREVLA